MPATCRSASTFARAEGHADSVIVQTQPSQHAENHYDGLFRGLGVTSREPVCNRRHPSLARLHQATHFAIGCKKWDDGARGPSAAHAAFTDPEVVYATCDAPDKNASVVELRQVRFDPDAHYRTEQRQRFPHPGAQPRDKPFKEKVTVHLGDDRPELLTQTGAVHCRVPDPEAQRSASLRSAGAGTLLPTSVWPKPVRCNPIDGGPRSLDNHDLGVANGIRFGRISGNYSAIVPEANVRNPIHGHHAPLDSYGASQNMHTTKDLVAKANTEVPPLRSLAAVRPM